MADNNRRKHQQRITEKDMRHRRMALAVILLLIGLVAILFNLVRLQVFDSTDQYSRQVDQLVEEVSLQAPRGNIYDRNKNVLAQDSSASAVNIIPLEVEDEEKVAAELSSKLGVDKAEVLKKINRIEDDKVEVDRGVSKKDSEAVIAAVSKGISYDGGTLYAVPDEIKDAKAAAGTIASILSDLEYDDAYEILTRKESNTVLIKGKVDNSLAEQIKNDLTIYKKDENGNDMTDEDGQKIVKSTNGIELIEDKRRYYTNGNFASYVLGFTGQDYNGLTGVEAVYDDYLSGENGIVYYQKDASGNRIPSQTKTVKEAKQGKDLMLTLDSNIQILAEKYLASTVTEWKAKSGTAIVMDTKTGEVLAMATKPDYNLNDPYTIEAAYTATHAAAFENMSETDKLEEMWKNPAVSFIYEPGSTFKAVTASTALEEGAVTPDTTVTCTGSMNVDGVNIGCTGVHGTQTVSEAIANSCNPGLIQIIQRLDPELFYQYIYNYGFGEATGIELTGEEAGIVNRVIGDDGTYNLVDYSTFSFGQGLASTPIQILSALNSVVNNGYYLNPTIIGKDSKQQEYRSGKLESAKQVISKETSAEMRQIMQQVVLENSTLAALSEGYEIGGKTGTAEKFIDGSYSSSVFVTSFFCYAPVDDPKYSILVILDEPDSSAYGGTSAAPMAISLMKQVLDYMGGGNGASTEISQGTITIPDLVGQEKDFAAEILDGKGITYTFDGSEENGTIVTAQSIAAQTAYEKGTELVLTLGSESSDQATTVTVPDLKGMSIQAANELAGGLGLKLKVTGSGFAKEQSPAAGTKVAKNSEISVKFGQ